MGYSKGFKLKQLRLVRLETNPYYGTFGILIIEGEVFCVTLEPYDRDNQQSISNIPAQQYICKLFKSPTYGWTFKITGIQGRSRVVFHPGNFVRNTKACILLAQYFGKIRGDRAVLNSGETFKQFMYRMKNDTTFLLTIVESY